MACFCWEVAQELWRAHAKDLGVEKLKVWHFGGGIFLGGGFKYFLFSPETWGRLPF